MSLSSSRMNVTKGVTSLEEQCKVVQNNLPRWRNMDVETLHLNIHEIVSESTRLEQRTNRLKDYMTKLDEVADSMEEPTNEELQKMDEYAVKVATILDTATCLLDELIIQNERGQKGAVDPNLSQQGSIRGSQQGYQRHQQGYQQGYQQDRHDLLDLPPIPIFNGNYWDFENFKTMFNEIVGKSIQPDLMKLNHLINSLEGEPKELIQKFRMNEDSYGKAMEFLQKKYGNKDKTIATLTEKLESETAKSGSVADQRRLLDKISVIISQLDDLGEPIETRIVKKMIVKKFAFRIQQEVYKHKLKLKNQNEQDWTIQQILEDIESFIDTEEELGELLQRKDKDESGKKSEKNDNKSSKKSKQSDKTRTCIFCKEEDHYGDSCQKFSTPNERIKRLIEENRCVQCLRIGHKSTDCRSKPCSNCKGKGHHSTTCKNKQKKEDDQMTEKKKPNAKDTSAKNKQKPTSERTVAAAKTQQNESSDREKVEDSNEERTTAFANLPSEGPNAAIPTVDAIAFNPKMQQWEHVSIMIDTGADGSYASEQLANKWNLPNHGKSYVVLRTFSQDNPKRHQFTKTEITLKTEDGRTITIHPFISRKLVGRVRKAKMLDKDMDFVKKYQLNINKDSLQEAVVPDIILGCDYIPIIMAGQQVPMPSGIVLMDTIFGHTSLGKPNSHQENYSDKQIQFSIMRENDDITQEIEFEQKREMQMKTEEEFTGSLKEEQIEANRKVVEHFKKNVEKREDGYYVRLPFKENCPQIPDNFAIALKRLESVYQHQSLEVRQMMDTIFKDQLDKQILEVVDINEPTENLVHYNPSQPVLTPLKTTTKCRVVVDGGAHFKNELALNGILEQGPTILPDLIDILIRFRSGQKVMISDVEKAFLQVRLHEDDRDATRVLWLIDITKPPTKDNIMVLRFSRVLFGLNCSPFLLGATINHHLECQENQELATLMRISTYVDNLILTTDQPTSEMVQTYRIIKEIFEEMGMNIREFVSNDVEFMESLDEKDRAEFKDTKVLGILWKPESDQIQMKCITDIDKSNSRRSVARTIASQFDPLGLLAPIILRLKLFQGKLWKEEFQYKWDTPLTKEHEEEWQKIISDIEDFQMNIPRNIVDLSGINTIITFTDASQDATACCIYIKNSIGINILCGKSKVKPEKEKWTIPKLETQALKMGVQQVLKVVNALQERKISIKEVIVLTDSSIALCWLKAEPGRKEIGVFLSNRLKSIRTVEQQLKERQISIRFGHVSTNDNPADLATRGTDKVSFAETNWWTGPTFIESDPEDWPETTELFEMQQFEDFCQFFSTNEQQDVTVFNFHNTNNYIILIRTAVVTLKFIKKFFQNKNFSKEMVDNIQQKIPALKVMTELNDINAEEMRAAEIILIKDHQKTIEKKNLQKWKNLGLEKNGDGIIICKGRMENSDLSDEAKFPILIKPKSQLAKQIILHCHGKYHNSKHQTTCTVREKFWIPQLQQQVKSILQKCAQCQRAKKLPFKYPNMGALPGFRVKRARPFEIIGLDYFGPITYRKSENETGTAFGALFTCAVTRLTHIELVPDYKTTSFLMAIRRFASLRGMPSKIISDNAPAHILGHKIIKDAITASDLTEDIKEFLGVKDIEWTFITPHSPWKSGFYEGLVKIAKEAFTTSQRLSLQSYEELGTIFTEISAAMNGRPLTIPRNDISDPTPIRPSDFICSSFPVTLPLGGNMESLEEYLPSKELQKNETKRSTLEYLQASVEAVDEVWKKWVSLYLTELREYHKLRMNNKRGSMTVPKVGQPVIICEELQSRNYWKLGEIIKLVPSTDNVIREVIVRTITEEQRVSELRKSINHIVPLELDEPENDETEEENTTEDEVNENQLPIKETSERYNLRERRKINYNENTSFGSITTKLPLLFMIIMTTLIGNTMGQVDNMKWATKAICTTTGLQIQGSYDSFQACVRDYCTPNPRFQLLSSNQADIWIPPYLKLTPHHATIKIRNNGQISIWELDCPEVPFCETIDCTICWTNILNPECHITFAIMGLGVLIFMTLMLFHMICNVPVKLGAPFRMAGKIIKWTGICFFRILTLAYNKYQRGGQRRNRWREIIVIICTLVMMKSVHGCQEIDIVTQFETLCNTNGQCKTVTEEVMHLNNVHKEGCLRIEKNGTTLRDIRVQLVEIELHCVKRTITYTQDIETRVWSSKRCPRMGSCTGQKCSNITRDSIIPELNAVNNYVGNTGCAESCGGAGCGCFYLSSGCLFYRTYAFPRSAEAIEVFNCMDYQPMAKLRMTVTTLNSYKNSAETLEILSPIGRTTSFMQIAVTVDAITTPPSPAMNTWFIRDNSSTATWNQGLMPSYQCDRLLKKCILEEQCQCSPAENRMQCTCKDIDIAEHFRQPDKHLPIQSGHLRLECDKDSIKGKIQSSTSTTLSLRMTDKWKTRIVKSAEVCKVENAHAKGCYSCATGATAEVTCQSTTEDTMANMECGEESFAIPCSTNGATSNVTFHSNYAKFQRNCTIDCGGKQKEYFEITGILKFSGSVWTSIYRLLDGNATIYNEINLPDVGHLLESYLTYMKTVLTVIVIVALVFLMTYSCLTKTGITIVKAIFGMMFTIISLPIRLVQRNRRHGHLHTLIFMIITLPNHAMGMSTATHEFLHNPQFNGPIAYLPAQKVNFWFPNVPNHFGQNISKYFEPKPFHSICLSNSSYCLSRHFSVPFFTHNQGKSMSFSDLLNMTTLPNMMNNIMAAIQKLEATIQPVVKAQEELMQRIINVEHKADAVLELLGYQFPCSRGASPYGDLHVPEPDNEIIMAVGEEIVEHESNLFQSGPLIRKEKKEITITVEQETDGHLSEEDPLNVEVDEEEDSDEEDTESGRTTVKSTVVKSSNFIVKKRILERHPKDHGKMSCIFCGHRHLSDKCPRYSTFDDRVKIVERKRLCMKCINAHRHHDNCNHKQCYYCGSKSHHSSLCNHTETIWKSSQEKSQQGHPNGENQGYQSQKYRDQSGSNWKNDEERRRLLEVFDNIKPKDQSIKRSHSKDAKESKRPRVEAP